MAAVASGISVQTAAKSFGVARTTLRRAIRQKADPDREVRPVGRPSRLGGEVEAMIEAFFLTCSDRGLYLPKNELPVAAAHFARQFGIDDFLPTEKWCRGFLKRHPDMSSLVPRELDVARVNALTPDVADRWIVLVKKVYEGVFGGMDKVDPSRVWNFDESPMSGKYMGSVNNTVLARKGTAPKISTTNSSREFNTVVLAVNAAGGRSPVGFIHRGQSVSTYYAQFGVKDALFAATEKGAMTEECFLGLLKQYQTTAFHSSEAHPVVLFIDNHKAHISTKVILQSRQMGIHLVGLPPNTTSALQPLDAAVFGAIKHGYKKLQLQRLLDATGTGLEKGAVESMMHVAVMTRCTPAVVQRGFKVTGLWPLSAETLISYLPRVLTARSEDARAAETSDSDDDFNSVDCNSSDYNCSASDDDSSSDDDKLSDVDVPEVVVDADAPVDALDMLVQAANAAAPVHASDVEHVVVNPAVLAPTTPEQAKAAVLAKGLYIGYNGLESRLVDVPTPARVMVIKPLVIAMRQQLGSGKTRRALAEEVVKVVDKSYARPKQLAEEAAREKQRKAKEDATAAQRRVGISGNWFSSDESIQRALEMDIESKENACMAAEDKL